MAVDAVEDHEATEEAEDEEEDSQEMLPSQQDRVSQKRPQTPASEDHQEAAPVLV